MAASRPSPICDAGPSLLPMAGIAGPAVSRISEMRMRRHLEGNARPQFLPEALGQHIPDRAENVFSFALAGDIMLIASLFVLGGDFWDKLRSLFVYDARATFPVQAAAESPA